MTRGRVVAVVVAAALLLVGCAPGPALGGNGIVVGTSLPVRALDPAADAGPGGALVAQQIYPHLVTIEPGTDRLIPDVATSAGFDAAGDYVVTVEPGLRFANGHRLDASDVVSSLTRQRAIAAPGGPSPLLAGIASVTARGSRTVVFRLTTPGDQGFPAILASAAGAIVDEQVFPAHALARDADVVAAEPFAGPYVVESFTSNLLTFVANPGYRGALGAPHSRDVSLKVYADARNLAADVAGRAIDLAYGGLGPDQVRRLRDDPGVRLVSGPGGELRFLMFDLDSMPYGARRPDADPRRAQAVRTAVADLVDRDAIAEQVDAGTTAPLWGFTSDHLPGAEPVLRGITGDGRGHPDASAAEQELDAADVDVPVHLRIAAVPGPDGADPAPELRALQAQLERSGLVVVELDTVTAARFAAERSAGAWSAFPLAWSVEGVDPVTYRVPYLLGQAQPAHATADLHPVQEQLAIDLPMIPLVQQNRIAASGTGVQGVRLDGSFTLRFASLRRG